MVIQDSSRATQFQWSKSLITRTRDVRAAITVPIMAMLLMLSGLQAPSVHAQSCPFDDGNSSLEVEGLILTRYALGITGAPLVASTNINAVDAPTVEASINCPSCGLNITGNPTMTVADATIISRKLAGFSGASLTSGLALGSGTRNTPAAVQSFLLAGCGATGGTVTSITAGSGLTGGTITTSGTIAADTTFLQRRVASNCAAGSAISAINADGTVTCAVTGQANAFVQGGNSFGAAAVLGTNDAQPLTVKSGSSQLNVFIAGGHGLRIDASNPLTAGLPNVVNGDASNTALGAVGGTIAGGSNNSVTGYYSSVGGGNGNTASANFATVAGGAGNTASGDSSFVAGGVSNTADGPYSFAAGRGAQAAHQGAFVWSSPSSSDVYGSVAANSFNIRASGGVYLDPTTNLNFGATTRQMINLWGTTPGIDAPYGIGVQSLTTYFRTDSNGGFCWFAGGVHNNASCNAGGGSVRMFLNATSLFVNGTFVSASDRNLKENIRSISARDMLAKVVALPMNVWNYRQDEKKVKHIGPMAQDFKRLFNVGQDDKTISTTDASGVAIAAIQGLNQKLTDEVKALRAKLSAKDEEATTLKARLAAIEKKLGL